MPSQRLRADDAIVLVVDVQEKLLPHMHNAGDVERQVGRLLDGAAVLKLPVLVTEQYRKGLGLTVEPIRQRLPKDAFVEEKLLFSACTAGVQSELQRLGRRSVIVCGIEAHVCMLQTCLDLLEQNLAVFLAADAVGARRLADQQIALQRLVQAGVVPTSVESALLEMVRAAGSDQFKAMLPIIK
jgi:nicotinamidase-related amidase